MTLGPSSQSLSHAFIPRNLSREEIGANIPTAVAA